MELLREKLDGVNLELLHLINKRAELVQEIGQVKEKQGINRYDPVRERKMLDSIEDHNQGPLDLASLKHIFKEIFKMGLGLRKRIRRKHCLFLVRKKQKIL